MILRTTTARPLILSCLILLFAGKAFSAGSPSDTTIKDILTPGTSPVYTDTQMLAKVTIPPASIPETYVTNSRYASANRQHAKMLDSLMKVVGQYPLRDSAGLNYATDFVGTPNMGLRRPNYVIIHHTATSRCNEVISEFTNTGNREASAHYVIDKDGTVYHMLNDLLRSHHAGDSKWGNSTDLNSSSIGIELVNNGYEAFAPEQIKSLNILLDRLKNAYKIPAANFIGHGDIAPSRKSDPNYRFPWKDLSDKGFGLWWDTTNVQMPDNFDYIMGLRIIGYDVSSPASAVAAFKRHYLGDNSGGNMNAALRRIIYALHRKFL